MKKIFVISLCLMVFCLTSCTGNVVSDEAVTPQDIVTPQDNTPQDAAAAQDPDTLPLQTPDDNLVYQNHEYGYQLTFPESWKGWYIIVEYDPGSASIKIKFFGKSKLGTGQEYRTTGLPMFFIIPKNEMENKMVDSVKKIGTIGGVDYYYATATGFDLGILRSITILGPDDDERIKYDAEELILIKNDWEKVDQMLDEVDEVLKTFKAIEK